MCKIKAVELELGQNKVWSVNVDVNVRYISLKP